MRKCVYKAGSSTTDSGLTKLPYFLMTQWLHLKANRRKGTWPILAKKMQGEEKNNNTWNTLRSRLLMSLGKESWAMVPRHPGWALYLPEGVGGEARSKDSRP